METRHRANHLHYHGTSIVPLDECKTTYDECCNYVYSKIDLGNSFICNQNIEGFTFAYGDEGNLLVGNNIMFSIASWTTGPKDYLNIYTNVFAQEMDSR